MSVAVPHPGGVAEVIDERCEPPSSGSAFRCSTTVRLQVVPPPWQSMVPTTSPASFTARGSPVARRTTPVPGGANAIEMKPCPFDTKEMECHGNGRYPHRE